MRDPFPLPPIHALSEAVQPWADKYNVPTLPLHIHEVLFSALMYTFVHLVVSPWLSMKLWPSYYPLSSRGKRANWDSHVVSMFQSCLINGMALYVMFADKERAGMDREQRIWGYTGAMGLVQAFAAGYFLWDLVTTILFLDVFGLGLLAHAASALLVYSFGFRPFLNYYGCTFILYELSTPFLNIHWFFDKLHMTGSKAQLYNGIALLFTFFSCRLVWGTIQVMFVYGDMWHAVRTAPTMPFAAQTPANMSIAYGNGDVLFFAKDAEPVPLWLAGLYIGANVTLNFLNIYWFLKMIKAVQKRFEPGAKKEDDALNEKVALDRATATTTGANGVMGQKFTELKQRVSIDSVPVIKHDLGEVQ